MTVDAAVPGFATTVEALRIRSWKLGRGQPHHVIDLFTDADFKVVVDDRADVHINSRDGRFYLGWFPSGRTGGAEADWVTDEGWVVAVTGTAKVAGYRMSFNMETPAEIISVVVAQILATSRLL
ncbi:DUF317 domain-containing protein [Streptomyces sp. NPDC006704]|uniref:DUF317 domain-containing protein n=1 Tax=Streptomyces sp. NPDC006704 TaxID=3364760 RepID=UPI003677E01A